ncbi:MAG: alpha/beta hydrolase [Hyphomicrobiaceae bacterium]|nr:alpha/beta hydrolase [Hyphomicrobiaceae bacterium]
MNQRSILVDPELDRRFFLSDGRTISYREYGALNGRVVLALHGTPGSRLKYKPAHIAAGTRGLRIISPDRWGYGFTQAPRTRSLSFYSDDIIEFTKALGVASFSVVGISGGAPFAAVLAAEMPEYVVKLALVSPVGRVAEKHLSKADIYSKYPLRRFHRFCFLSLPRVPGATRIFFWLYRLAMIIAPAHAVKIAIAGSSISDKRAMSSVESRHTLGKTFAAGLQNGVLGPIIDLNLFAVDWDFDIKKIRSSTKLWIGEDDLNVPIGSVLALARDISGATLLVINKQGHFWISENFSDVLDWIAGIETTR